MPSSPSGTAAHEQTVTRRYRLHYPFHLPRADDPYYAAFNAYHRAHAHTATCAVGDRGPAFHADCKGGVELHHKIIEFALINGVDIDTFCKEHAGVTNLDELEKWAETDANFQWLCAFHHRGHAGVHVASASDWSNEMYIPGLID